MSVDLTPLHMFLGLHIFLSVLFLFFVSLLFVITLFKCESDGFTIVDLEYLFQSALTLFLAHP